MPDTTVVLNALTLAEQLLLGDGALALGAAGFGACAVAVARRHMARGQGLRLMVASTLVFASLRLASGFLVTAETDAGVNPAPGVALGWPTILAAYAAPAPRAKSVAPRARGA